MFIETASGGNLLSEWVACMFGRSLRSAMDMTLGKAAAARVRLVASCKTCGYRAAPDVAALATALGEDLPVREWMARHRCSRCGARDVAAVVTGARR